MSYPQLNIEVTYSNLSFSQSYKILARNEISLIDKQGLCNHHLSGDILILKLIF